VSLFRVFAVCLALITSSISCLQLRSDSDEKQEKKAAESQVTQLQRSRADQEAQIQGYEAQLRAQNGRIETLEDQMQKVQAANEELQKKVTANEDRIKNDEQALLQLDQMMKSKPSKPPVVAEDSDKGSDKKKNPYDEAEDHFAQKDWKKALTLYEKYRVKNPNGEHYPMATYKMAVSFQELKMNKEAKLFYEEVVEKFPKSKVAKQATFRLNQMKKK